MYRYIFCRHTLMRGFVSLCLFLRHSVLRPRQPLALLLKDTGRERTDGNKDNCLLWTLREMHNAYKVSSKVNGKTINLLYLHCVHRLWAAFRNGAWWLQEVRKHISSPSHWGWDFFVLPKVTHTNGAGIEAGYFKFFGCLMVTRSFLCRTTASLEQSQSSSSIPQPTQCSAALWYWLWSSLSRKGDFAQQLQAVEGWDVMETLLLWANHS